MGSRQTMREEADAKPPIERQLTEVTCAGCGCLCDDLTLRVQTGKIDASGVPCTLAQSMYVAAQDQVHRVRQAPEAQIAGQPAPLAEVLGLVAERLTRARAPLILGPTESSMEAQRAAVALADVLSAGIDTGLAASGSARWLARQRAGWVGATWGEIKQRADLVLCWDVDLGPGGPHPRFAKRFLEPPGRFIPEGLAGRTVLHLACWSDRVAGVKGETAIVIQPSHALATLAALRTLVRGGLVDLGSLATTTGQPAHLWAKLAQQLKAARFGVIVVGPIFDRHASLAECEGLERLIAELNVFGQGRFVGCTIGQVGNRPGLEAVLGWQAGAPRAVDFSHKHPRYLPLEAEASHRIAEGQADVVLAIGPQQAATLAQAHATRPFWIQIGHNATLAGSAGLVPDLAMATAHPWLEAGGTVMRSDGVPLPLTPLLRPLCPTDAQMLERLRRQIVEQGARVP